MERYLLHEFTMHLLKPPRIYWFVPGKIRPVSDINIFARNRQIGQSRNILLSSAFIVLTPGK